MNFIIGLAIIIGLIMLWAIYDKVAAIHEILLRWYSNQHFDDLD